MIFQFAMLVFWKAAPQKGTISKGNETFEAGASC